MHTKFWSETLKERDDSKNLGVHGNMILEWNLEIQCGKLWIGLILLRTGTNCGPCEHFNESYGSVKVENFLTIGVITIATGSRNFFQCVSRALDTFTPIMTSISRKSL